MNKHDIKTLIGIILIFSFIGSVFVIVWEFADNEVKTQKSAVDKLSCAQLKVLKDSTVISELQVSYGTELYIEKCVK